MKAQATTYRCALALVLLTFSALVAAPALPAEAAAFRVIVHKDNPADSISSSQLSQYLLGTGLTWKHGVAVEPIDLGSNAQTRSALSREVHGRSVSSIKNYWQQQIFSGDGVPPPEAASDFEVIRFVKAHPGAIGYVSANARLDGVKELTLTE